MENSAYISEVDENESSSIDENKYIIFRLGNEIYGTRLLDIREVVEELPIKTIPNTCSSFMGVCNLRGQIIGVIDLRVKFGVTPPIQDRPILLVYETESGTIAAKIDEIISVSVILPLEIERKAKIVTNVPSTYIEGIGKLDKHLITIMKLREILSTEEFTEVNDSKILAKAI